MPVQSDDVGSWADFTRSNYRRLLQRARDAYQLTPVAEFDGRTGCAIWRHDVDASPQSAAAFAAIEHDLGVRATYYFNLRSEFYNLFEPDVAALVARIAGLGHEIGLHFDAANARSANEAELERSLEIESGLFRDLLGMQVRSFSFHNPSSHTGRYIRRHYAGLFNAYCQDLLDAVRYCSDSNGYWRFTPLEEFLGHGHQSICVLTHPEWWTEVPQSPRNRIVRCVEGRAAATLRRYDDLLRANQRCNIQ